MQVISLCKTCLPSDTRPIHNKNIAVFSSADISKCKQKGFICQTEKSLSHSWAMPHPAVQQSPGPSRAEHHLWEHLVLNLQTHKFGGLSVDFSFCVQAQSKRTFSLKCFGIGCISSETGFFVISLRNQMKPASVRGWIWSFQRSLAKW